MIKKNHLCNTTVRSYTHSDLLNSDVSKVQIKRKEKSHESFFEKCNTEKKTLFDRLNNYRRERRFQCEQLNKPTAFLPVYTIIIFISTQFLIDFLHNFTQEKLFPIISFNE